MTNYDELIMEPALHNTRPVPDYELNETERNVVDSFKQNMLLLLQGQSDNGVHIHQNHAHSLAQETLRETLVSELGEMLNADLDAALLSTENELDITIGTNDREHLKLDARSGSTRATVRQIDMPVASKIYRLREIEFPVMVKSEGVEPVERWNRIISAFKVAPSGLVESVTPTA